MSKFCIKIIWKNQIQLLCIHDSFPALNLNTKISWFQWECIKIIVCSFEVFSLVECDEWFLCNVSKTLWITVVNHVLDFRFWYFLVKLLGHLHQVFLWNVSFVVLINVFENPFNILIWVIFAWLLSHKFDKLLKTDLTSIICIKYWHGYVNKSSSWLISTVFPYGFSEIQRSQHSIVVIIQKIEDLLVNFNVTNCAFGNDKLFRVEIHVPFWITEAWFCFLLWSAVLELWYSEGSSATAHLRMSIHTHFVMIFSLFLIGIAFEID